MYIKQDERNNRQSIETKRCAHCKRELPIECFQISYFTIDGYYRSCIECNDKIREEQKKINDSKPFWIRMDPMLTKPD